MALVLTRLVRSNYDELDNIPIIHQDLTVSFTKQADTYYIHTGSTTPLYTKGRMYYCDGTNLKKVVVVDELPPAPNNGKLTITVNGTAYTFTANQSGDTSFSITDTDTGATKVEVTGAGNAVTTASYDAPTRKITLTKGTTFQEKLTAGSNITINGNTISAKDTTYTFTPDNPTLAWNTTSKIGTIGGVEFNITMPANPDTDTGVAEVEVTGTGNAVTTASYNPKTRKLTLAKGMTFLMSHQDISGKLDKTTYEWNKEFRAGQNGAISLGRYYIYDTQLTFDISSTTSASINGKLVIAAQNGVIKQAKVFGDATGALVSKIVIYQSAIINNRSWVEVFCNFDGWSKNKVHIYGVALESATVTNQMSSVTFTNGVPSPITNGDSKWNHTIDNDLSVKQNKLTAGSNITISGNTISATDTNTSHSHSAGVGLVGSGNAGTSGTYNYKVKLRNETALTVDSAAATTTSGRVYPVAVDKSGYLSVNVPWNDTNSTYDAGTGLNLSHGVFSAKLNNTASLGTIGTTSKLYAVGVDANGKLCVKVPWTDTNTIKSAALSDNILTLELG